MLRKNRSLRLHRDFRGKITVGNRGKADNEHPRALEYFNLVNFPELKEIYGEKPTEIYIILLSDNIEDFFQDGYSKWGKKSGTAFLLRKCDGETAYDPISENYFQCHQCYSDECTIKADDRCRPFGFLRALVTTIPDPEKGIPPVIINMSPYQFEWHSENSGDNVYSELYKTWQMTGGRLFGVPMKITVKMNEELKKDGGGKTYKKKYPLIYLEQVGSIDKVIAIARAKILPTLPENTELYKQLSTTTNTKALAPPETPAKPVPPKNTNANDGNKQPPTDDDILEELRILFTRIGKGMGKGAQQFRATISERIFNVTTWAELEALDREEHLMGRDILIELIQWVDKNPRATNQGILDQLETILLQQEIPAPEDEITEYEEVEEEEDTEEQEEEEEEENPEFDLF